MNDFSTPRRMGASAFIIIFLKTFKEFVGASIFIILYLFFDHEENRTLLGSLLEMLSIIAGFTAISLLFAFIRYYFRKFHIEGDKLVFTSGLANKKTTSFPLSRVHSLRTTRGIFYRLLGVRGVFFETIATDKAEVELILDESDWQLLLNSVRVGENKTMTVASTPPPPAIGSNVRLSNKDIVKDLLCQNHLRGFAVLAAVISPVIGDLDSFDNDVVVGAIDSLGNKLSDAFATTAVWICCLLGLYLLVMTLWVIKGILRNANMSLTILRDRLTVESGLFSRFTCRVARNKVSVLSVKQNPLERLAHCQTISLRQAENASDKESGGQIIVYGPMLGQSLLSWWLDSSSTGEVLVSAKSGTGVFYRRFIPYLIFSLIFACLLAHFGQMVLAITLCSAIVLISAIRALMAYRHSSVNLFDSYLLVKRGNLAVIHDYITYRDIESVSVKSTPMTPYTGRVSLRLSTNAETLTVFSLEADIATDIRDLILLRNFSI